MRKGLKVNLPLSAEDNVLFFTNDSGEIYKGNGIGSPLIKYCDVIYETTLPTSGEEGKIYLIEDGLNGLKMYSYRNTNWIDFSSNGGGVDNNVLNMLLGLEDKVDTFGYDLNENVISIDTVYSNPNLTDENTVYSYDIDGNVISEEITKLGKKITSTFIYDVKGNISSVSTVVANI